MLNTSTIRASYLLLDQTLHHPEHSAIPGFPLPLSLMKNSYMPTDGVEGEPSTGRQNGIGIGSRPSAVTSASSN